MRSRSKVREIETYAKAYCEKNKLKLTEGREAVLRAVVESDEPVKAYDLIASFTDDGKKPMPPIIYRALDFWTAHGFIHRIDSLNAYTCCTHPGHLHDCHLFVCDECGKVFELCDHSLTEGLQKTAAKRGFSVDSFKVEVRGRCPECG